MTRPELLEIYNAEHERFNKTRDIQWRFNIAVWTLLLIAIYFAGKGDLHMPREHPKIIAYGFSGAYLTAIYLLQVSMQVSRKLFVQVIRKLNATERPDGFEVKFKSEWFLDFGKAWLWLLFQLGTVALFLWTLWSNLPA